MFGRLDWRTRLEINGHPYYGLFGEMGHWRTRLEINSHPYFVCLAIGKCIDKITIGGEWCVRSFEKSYTIR